MNNKELAELDALVAEKVMGINLKPPREYAMAKVGQRYVSITGPEFKLTTGEWLRPPHGTELPQPEGSDDWNDRYYLFVARHLGDRITAEVDGYRNAPKPYSREISAAWEVFEEALMQVGHASIHADMEDWGRRAFTGNGAERVVTVIVGDAAVTAPVCEAICRAALASLDGMGE